MPAAKEALEYADLTARAREEADALAKANQPPTLPTLTTVEKAERLKQLATATYLYAALVAVHGPATFDVASYKLLLDDYLQAAGAPTDPVERMLLEQLFIAHHVAGRLHARAGTRERLEEVQAFLAAAARLMGEFRRSLLALNAYRERPADKHADAPVPQGEPKRKRPAAGTSRRRGRKKTVSSGELGSNTNRFNGDLREQEPVLTESAADCRREAESPEAARRDR